MKTFNNKFSIILVISLAVILALVHTNEATCANKAVYDDCCSRGNTQLTACYAKPNDFPCQCIAMKAIRNCYLQCPDDSDIISQGNSYQTAVDQVCGYANQQTASSAPAPTQAAIAPAGSANATTPTTPTNPSVPNGPSSPNKPTPSGTQSATQPGTKSSANSNNDGRQIFFAVILSVAVLFMAV
ncbi:gpi anchored serine-threonine rich protein [Gigaspora margarita]|uniref:Gpi anchored serine-threonine rich protein n=1 Tax=Gigaspora margarita TaxID=4874 RepID=A0A8H4B3B9_GIGMA|nr:gpi anchored serine-threonine rich protein [Gigaspora margarita]